MVRHYYTGDKEALILAHINKHPEGSNAKAVAKALNMLPLEAGYHLGIMSRRGQIRLLATRQRYRVYYPLPQEVRQ